MFEVELAVAGDCAVHGCSGGRTIGRLGGCWVSQQPQQRLAISSRHAQLLAASQAEERAPAGPAVEQDVQVRLAMLCW